MVAALRRVSNQGALHRVTRPGEIDTVLDRLMATKCVVYAKDRLDHGFTVVDYVARYQTEGDGLELITPSRKA